MSFLRIQRSFTRTVAVLLSLILIVGLLPLNAVSVMALDDGTFQYELIDDNTAVSVTGYLGESLDVVIPKTIADLPVKAIGDKAFDGRYTLTSITLPNGLVSIGTASFRSCAALTTITIPGTVKTIGETAFYNCIALAAIDIGTGTYNFGYRAFHNTAWLNAQSTGCVYLGRVLYSYKGTMPEDTEITVNAGTAAIAPSAFSGFSTLKSISLPVGLKTIGAWAFLNCLSLDYIRIPATVTAIGVSAFENDTLLNIYGADNSYADTYATDNSLLFTADHALEFVSGDINDDGRVTSTDIRILMQILLDPNITSDIDRVNSCDFNDDGLIDTSDCRQMFWLSLT